MFDEPMNEKPTAYAAMITISLPGTDKTATASVRVLPEEDVILPSGTKLLRDCTLAELQTFANTWEAEVWETYQHINLLDLESDKGVQVEVLLIGQTGEQALESWAERAVLLTPGEEVAEERPETAVPETIAATSTAIVEEPSETAASPDTQPTIAEEPAAIQASEAKPETRDETAVSEEPTPATPAADALSPEVIVSESEPVYAEEVEELEPVKQPQLPPRPQVRIAGQRLPLGRAKWASVDIFMEEPALRQAQAHALSSPTREVAGVLVGPRPEKQPDGRYNVYVTDTIIAKYTVMQGASVTYTPESWRYMNDQLWQRYPDESAIMVGWYHTHPGFGIFLSGMDQFIHQNFFTQPWHVALVLDPIAKTSGYFCWDRHHSRVSRYDFPWPTWAAEW